MEGEELGRLMVVPTEKTKARKYLARKHYGPTKAYSGLFTNYGRLTLYPNVRNEKVLCATVDLEFLFLTNMVKAIKL